MPKNVHWGWVAVGFLAGVMLAPKVRTLPLLDKLPSV